MRDRITHRLFLLSASTCAYARLAEPDWYIIAIDGYADTDLQADEIVRVPLQEGQFTAEVVAEVVVRAEPDDWLIYGSGFERHPELLDELAQHVQVLGNLAETVGMCADPPRLAHILAEIAVRHPEIWQTPPASPDEWLCKRIGRSGGAHVRPAEKESATPGKYWQRRIAGTAYSIIFFAAKDEVKVLGVNRLLPAEAATGTYVWTGAIAPATLKASVQKQLEQMAQTLSCALGLIGLCGFDFIIDEDNLVNLVDLNPRLTATCILHKDRLVGSILKAHADVCLNHSVEGLEITESSKKRAVHGLRVVYALSPEQVSETFIWPYFCTDIPSANTVIEPGQPICTVHSAAPSDVMVEDDLRRKCSEVIKRIQSEP